MARIIPFEIVHYNGNCAKDMDRIITPPYDVISKEEQDGFYTAHPLNIIRVVLGRQLPDDGPDDNKYTRAAAVLRDWLTDGVLVRTERPGLVVYQMEFQRPDGGTRVIDGLITLVKVEDYGKGRVLPHEKTYKGPKKDQLSLLRACRAHITPIHALFSDPEDVVTKEYSRFTERPPDREATDIGGSVHRVWFVHDETALANIVRTFEEKSLFIADGHHRYETALAYRKEIEASGSPAGGHENVMMYLTSMSHPGLTILPAHRMIKGMENLDIGGMLQRLAPYFEIEELPFSPETREETAEVLINRIGCYSQIGGKFGVAVHGEQCFRLLRIKDFTGVESLMDRTMPKTLRGLDVTILREAILGHGLGIDGENAEGLVEYSPSAADAIERVRKGDVQLGFIMNPTRVDQMQAAAELGHKLPHKSTYFYPKLASGLAMNVF
ncbi:MAG: DUF1015 domain-containing protein [Pseudomonadota bacterium]